MLVGSATNLQLQNFTIEAWIKRASASVVTFDPNAYEGNALFFAFGLNGYGFGLFPDGALDLTDINVDNIQSSASVTDTNLHHVAVTKTGSAVIFYVDGVAYPAASPYNDTFQFSTPAAIGARGDDVANGFQGQVNSFFGIINDLSIYNRALASNEIAAIYDAGSAGKCLPTTPTLTITVSNASMIYGGTVPALGLSYSGFVNGDTPASLTVAPSITTSATSLSHAGSYPILAAGGVDPNYNIVYAQGTLTINPAPLTLTANNATNTYGQTAALSGTAFTSVGLLNGDTIAGVTMSSAGAASTAGVGAYPIVPSAASGPRAGNYSITYSNGTMTVIPAALTLTADNENKYYGRTLNFAGTEFTAIGLQNGDTVGSVTLISGGAAASATVAGSPYSITPSAATGGTFVPANYTIVYVKGSLTVFPVGALPTITSVVPAAGPNTGGTTVTITGTGFENGIGVTFGLLPASMVTVDSSTVLTVVTPASPSGTVGVGVHNPDGNSVTNANAFAFGNAPDIATQPTNVTINQGQTARFAVQATGDPTLAYQWQYNGASLLEDSHASGTKTGTLTVSNATPGDDGNYRCIVTNLYEKVASTSAVLSVIAPPTSLTVSPPSVAVGSGGSVSLSATVGGTAPFSYYWYQNGGLLAGQNGSVLNIASAQASASYTVVVSNAAGTATSAPVALTLLGYCANVQAAQSTYPEGTNFIPLNVQTLSCGSSAPEPNAPVAVWLFTAGTTRALPVTTDASGNGAAIFTPLPVEVGLVQYGVALPGQPAPAASGSFTIIGMNLSAQSQLPQLVVGVPQTNTLLLNNLTSVPLTGITATVLGAPSDVNVQVSVPASLPGNGSAQTTFILEATGTTPAQSQFSIQFNSAQGASVTLPFSATIVHASGVAGGDDD